MNKKTLATAVAVLSFSAGGALADSCPKHFTEVDVSGSVTTSVTGENTQAGSIDMQLTFVDQGKVLFDKQGAITGVITGGDPDAYPPYTLLNHAIVFDNGAVMNTVDDFAVIYGAQTPCDLLVKETISNYTGTKVFKKATGNIQALGTLNICTGANQFELSGTMCIEK